jgi:hypothetical protein
MANALIRSIGSYYLPEDGFRKPVQQRCRDLRRDAVPAVTRRKQLASRDVRRDKGAAAARFTRRMARQVRCVRSLRQHLCRAMRKQLASRDARRDKCAAYVPCGSTFVALWGNSSLHAMYDATRALRQDLCRAMRKKLASRDVRRDKDAAAASVSSYEDSLDSLLCDILQHCRLLSKFVKRAAL